MELCFIPKNEIIGDLQNNPNFSMDVLKHMARDLKESDNIINYLNRKNLNFYIPTKSPISNKDAVSETLKLDCFILNMNKDLVNTSDSIYDYIIKFKPAQKILLPFSAKYIDNPTTPSL